MCANVDSICRLEEKYGLCYKGHFVEQKSTRATSIQILNNQIVRMLIEI